MTHEVLNINAVLAAADDLIAGFTSGDAGRYFDCFTADADFVFHTEPERLRSRADYELLWSEWTRAGWRVDACDSSDRDVRVMGTVAIFTHSVHTTTSVDATASTVDEHETIVFAMQPDGRLRAVHEHLSAPTVHR